jgi:membrane-associated protease RseP (regulator of RpoE activity)
MAFTLGVVVIALGILIAVCLHEAGHMLTAKAFGMKVTQYFAGFGPTLWSFRKGETEYGIKAIPLGGFVKIVGMTPQDDDVPPGEEHRAMWRFPVWKRTIVMSAGSVTHFMLAFVALWLAAMFMGLPNPALPNGMDSQPPVADVQDCVIVANEPKLRDCTEKDPTSPASAHLEDGDLITAVNGKPVANWGETVAAIRPLKPGEPATISVVRDGVTVELKDVKPAAVQRLSDDGKSVVTVSALGVGLVQTIPGMVTYGPVDALGASAKFGQDQVVRTFAALKKFPEKLPKLWAALGGAERDPETPISVVGVSRLGGEAVSLGLWEILVFLFIGLNIFVGIFNLLPLLPLDGGHIAIAWFEKIRSWFYARLGRPDPGRVDYYKLMPITYLVIFIFGGLTLLTVGADIVNPITLIPR